MAKIKKEIRIICVQHPNGETWITANDSIPAHLTILAEKIVSVEFDVDIGSDQNRAYPDGKIRINIEGECQ